jgi:hypothetical protein
MATRTPDPVIVGWREVVALPDWGIRAVRAKIDTGARTSAIHVDSLAELPDGRVRFDVVVREKPTLQTVRVEADLVRRAVVKPSHGKRQERLVCRTVMRIGPLEHEVELSLVSRKGMLCRMLVGRRALPGHVLVDPGRKYLHGGVKVRRRRPEGEDT